MKKFLSFILSLTLVFGVFAFASVEPSYAATKKPAKVTGLKVVKKSETSVKLTWKKAKRAKQYQIFRKKEGEKEYKCLGSVSVTRCIFTGIQPGKKYSYKIRAINGKKFGKFSSVKSITLPIVVKKSITSNVASLSFGVQEEKTVSFTCTDIKNLDYAISPVAEVVRVTTNNGVTTYTIAPKTNGSGILQVYDRNDSSVSKSIPITVNIKSYITNTIPYSCSDCPVIIKECRVGVERLTASADAYDKITISYTAEYKNICDVKHSIPVKVYNQNGIEIKTGSIDIWPGPQGQVVQTTYTMDIDKHSLSDFYKITLQ